MNCGDKNPLNLKEPEDALAWIDAFHARCAEKKTDRPGTNTAAQDYQITDQFLFRCGVESLKKLKALVAPKNIADMPFKDIETELKKYVEPRKRLTIAEQTKFVSIAQHCGESASDFLARLCKAARHCEFDKLKTNADPETYMIKVRFIAGLSSHEQKMRLLEFFQNNENATLDDLLTCIQQREQSLRFAKLEPTVKEEVAFGSKKKFSKSKSQSKFKPAKPEKDFKRSRCGSTHPPKACPAYGKTCSKCRKPNHYAAMCRGQGNANFNCEIEEDAHQSNIDFSYFIGNSDYNLT